MQLNEVRMIELSWQSTEERFMNSVSGTIDLSTWIWTLEDHKERSQREWGISCWECLLIVLRTLFLAAHCRLGWRAGKAWLNWAPYLQWGCQGFEIAKACWELNIRGDLDAILLMAISKYKIINREWIAHL